MNKRRTFNKTTLLLAGIVALGLFYNLTGVRWGLPALWYPDEPETIERIVIPMARNFDLNPHIFYKGSLFYYFLLLILTPYFAVIKLFHLQTADSIRLIGQVTLISRIATACTGAFGVVMAYWIGKRLRNSAAGIAAAFLLAVNVGYSAYSHFAYMEVPMVVLFLVSLYFGLRHLETFTRRDLFLSAFSGGLAVSAKYNAALLVLVFLFVLHWARAIRPSDTPAKRNGAVRRFFSREFFLSVGLAVFAFFLTTPYSILDYRTFLSYMVKQSMISKEGYKVFAGSYTWGGNFLLVEKAFGWPMFVLLTGAYIWVTVRWFKNRDAKEALVLAPPLVYFLYIGTWRLSAIRYVLPVIPFLIFAAVLVDIRRMKKPAREIILAVFLTVCGYSAAQGYLSIRCFTNDTRFAAEQWIARNVPRGGKVEMYSYKMYLPRLSGDLNAYRLTPNFVVESVGFETLKKSDIGRKFLWNAGPESAEPDNRPEFTVEALKGRNPDYVLLSSFYDDRYVPSPDNKTAVLYPELGRYYEALVGGAAGYAPAAVFKNDRMQEFYLNPTITILMR
jgi:hypothetical protein